jgi:hypothetical protein
MNFTSFSSFLPILIKQNLIPNVAVTWRLLIPWYQFGQGID